MPKNNQSDTLRQRKKAQESLLELKRLQAEGEIEKPHVSYENEIKPTTFKEKLSHFWYYYKGAVIAVVIAAVIISFVCVQCASTKPDDIRVVLYDNHIVTDNQTRQIEKYLESVCKDYNGDGTVKVTVINCTFETGSSTADYQLTKQQRLQSAIAADKKATVFITSKETYNYVDNLSDSDLLWDYFELNQDFYNSVDTDFNIDLQQGLVISVRKIEGTLIEDNKTAIEFYKRAIDFCESLKQIQAESVNEAE